MAGFAIGEVEELLGLPASTLRHWERVLPLLSPRKDQGGRRVYSEAELRLLFRLRHLTRDRGLGLPEAAARLVEELAAETPEHRAGLAEARGELIRLWKRSREAAGAYLRRAAVAEELLGGPAEKPELPQSP